MLSRLRKRMKGEKGFTLIELLVVIIIIAILAAIAIPTFLGQRQKAQDAAAKSLVRNAMTTIESAYVDLRTFDASASTDDTMNEALLEGIEPSIQFVYLADAATDPTTASVPGDVATTIPPNSVNFTGADETYQVGTTSASGRTFGVSVNKGTTTPVGNIFYVDGVAKAW